MCLLFTLYLAQDIYIPCTFSVICSAEVMHEIEITFFMSCTLETRICPQVDIVNDIHVHVDSTCICNSC